MATQNVVRFCNFLGTVRSLQRITLSNPNYIVRCKSISERAGLPAPPKRPLTPFFKYMKLVRSDVSHSNPKITTSQLLRIIAQKWEKADPQMKKNFEDEYTKEKESYLFKKSEYDASLTDKDKEAISKVKKERADQREKRVFKKKCKDMEKPHRPPSAFILYSRSCKDARGSKKYLDWVKEISEIWNSFTAHQKQPFVDEAKKLQEKYQDDMSLWEEKMIRLGNTDIIRSESQIEKTKHKITKSKTVK